MKTRKEAELHLADKARRDPAFRKELLADPKGVISRELGIGFSASVKLQVLEETPTTMYLVLPSPAANDAELAEAELDAVAGGANASASANKIAPANARNPMEQVGGLPDKTNLGGMGGAGGIGGAGGL